jgi:phthiodiolone/phenolphthiodiolone dimycocerosates ketoreductase
MKIGAAGTVRPPVGRVARDAARAEAAGYASMFFADHMMGWFPESIWTPAHTAAAALRPSAHDYLDPVCAALAAGLETQSIHVGLGVTDLLRSHPAVVARAALTLDHFTGGRFILGLGAGEAENVVPYGLSMWRAVDRLEEGLRLIRLLWQSRTPVSFSGPTWTMRDAVLGLEPLEGRPPPVWLAARGPRMRRIAAQLADGWFPMFIDAAEYGQSLAEIAAWRDEDGREGPFEAGFYAFVVVGDSKEQCLELFESPVFRCLALLLPAAAYARRGLEHPLGAGRYGLVDFVPTSLDDEEAHEVLARVPPEMVAEAVLHGSPDDIFSELGSLATAGCAHAVLANVSFLTDPALARPSYEALDDIARRAGLLGPAPDDNAGPAQRSQRDIGID